MHLPYVEGGGGDLLYEFSPLFVKRDGATNVGRFIILKFIIHKNFDSKSMTLFVRGATIHFRRQVVRCLENRRGKEEGEWNFRALF